MDILYQSNKKIYLTIDFEDYRYNFLRDFSGSKQYFIDEVEKQYWILKNILSEINAKAMFYIVGEVAKMLSNEVVNDINRNYDIGSHSLSHLKLLKMDSNEIYEDTKKSVNLIEDKFSKKIEHYRAPYFSIDSNENNYYEGIAKCGIKFSSSLRISKFRHNSARIIKLKDFPIIEIPLRSIGFGSKRITIIGGTYFRLFPISLIEYLIRDSIKKNFVPIIYLHNYEPDYQSLPIKNNNNFKLKANDWLRRAGRISVRQKLKILSVNYKFESLNDIVKNY